MDVRGAHVVDAPPRGPVSGRKIVSYWVMLVGVSVLLCFLALTKIWLALYALPLLVVVIPILFATRYTVLRRDARGTAGPSLHILALVQLIAVVAFYLCLPGISDDSRLMFLCVPVFYPGSLGANALWTLSAVSAGAFLASSVAIFVS